MKTFQLPLLLAAVLMTASFEFADAGAKQSANAQLLQGLSRSAAMHGRTPAGMKSLTVRVVGRAGTHFELYLGRAQGSKAILLASTRIPKGGVLRISSQFQSRLPAAKLYSQSSAPIRAKIVQVSP